MNTHLDELDAPRIDVRNDVDDEVQLPSDFFYTNEMRYCGDNVMHGELDKKDGCDCEGSCETNSKCRCLLRQRRYNPEREDFAYMKDGKLVNSDYPVFECNSMCGCGAECRNRVSVLSFFRFHLG